MKFRFLFSLSVLVLLVSCKAVDPNLIKYNQWDYRVMPDKYNTGAVEIIKDRKSNLQKFEASGYIVPDVYLTLRTDTNPYHYNLTSYGPNQKGLPDQVIIRDFDFSDYNFVIAGADRYSKNKHIIFENCKFKGFRNDPVNSNSKRVYITFNNCSFGGNVSSAYITLNNCKIGGFISDATNPVREYYANNVYIYDLVHETDKGDLHIDGVQIFGDSRTRNFDNPVWVSLVETGEIHFDNVRFEIPSIHFDNMPKGTAVNACIMFQLEFSDVDNVSFENIYANGGGKWFPLYADNGKNNGYSKDQRWSHKNFLMSNIKVSDNFGTIFYPDIIKDGQFKKIDHYSYLYVSSVWKDESGKVHVITTNDTKSKKTLTVKTDKGIGTIEIPHCPSNWALGGEINVKVETDEGLTDENGRAYTTYRWNDMPFDLDVVIPGNPDFVLCYDGEEQIRYVSLDNQDHFYTDINEKPISIKIEKAAN